LREAARAASGDKKKLEISVQSFTRKYEGDSQEWQKEVELLKKTIKEHQSQIELSRQTMQ